MPRPRGEVVARGERARVGSPARRSTTAGASNRPSTCVWPSYSSVRWNARSPRPVDACTKLELLDRRGEPEAEPLPPRRRGGRREQSGGGREEPVAAAELAVAVCPPSTASSAADALELRRVARIRREERRAARAGAEEAGHRPEAPPAAEQVDVGQPARALDAGADSIRSSPHVTVVPARSHAVETRVSAIVSPSTELSNDTVSSAAASRSNEESRPIDNQCSPVGRGEDGAPAVARELQPVAVALDHVTVTSAVGVLPEVELAEPERRGDRRAAGLAAGGQRERRAPRLAAVRASSSACGGSRRSRERRASATRASTGAANGFRTSTSTVELVAGRELEAIGDDARVEALGVRDGEQLAVQLGEAAAVALERVDLLRRSSSCAPQWPVSRRSGRSRA